MFFFSEEGEGLLFFLERGLGGVKDFCTLKKVMMTGFH